MKKSTVTEYRLPKEEYMKGKHLYIQRHWVHTFPLHAHSFYEIEIVLQGNGTHMLNGQRFPLQRGSVYLLSPADFHEVILTEPTQLWNIAFDETVLSPKRLERVFTQDKDTCRVTSESELYRLDIAAHLLEQECSSDGNIEPLIDYIVTTLLHTDGEDLTLTPIRRAILYIETHFRESPTLVQVAEQACLSPVYFGALFKRTTGQTYVQYLNSRRVRCARMLLKNGFSVSQACFSAGFGSLSAFLSAFKAETGLTPNAYREQHREEK